MKSKYGIIGLPITILAAVALFLSLSNCGEEEEYGVCLRDGSALFAGYIYPDGRREVDVENFTTEAAPGDTLNWTINYIAQASWWPDYADKINDVKFVASARRICDAQGRYRDQDAYYYSTYLTPAGLPVEGFQYFIANSAVGGPYKTPLDHAQSMPPDGIRATEDGFQFSLPVAMKLDEDFPPGLYRIEIEFFAHYKDSWIPLHTLPGLDSQISGCAQGYENIFYNKILLPPMRIGKIKQPRMIWTLFSSHPSGGVSGGVAEEDKPYFALSNRVKLPSQYILPCRPDREKCVYRIEPDLPTVHGMSLFMAKQYPYEKLKIDYGKGRISVSVTKPDGARENLGTHPIRFRGFSGPKILSGDFTYRFDQFGLYEISMTGDQYDIYGNRYEAGGTYKVWVAYPITFATGIKPGNPMRVGGYYPPAATLNPPVPAEVKASVSFYPGTHPQDSAHVRYEGKAQRFGYYFPDGSTPLYRFPEPGEYLFDIFAYYKDDRGRVYMGNMKNASVVLPSEANMTIVGAPPGSYDRAGDLSNTLNGDFSQNQGTIHFPYKSGDNIYFPGNPLFYQFIQPSMSVLDENGKIQAYLDEYFPPNIINLYSGAGKTDRMILDSATFPGCKEQLRYHANAKSDKPLVPLLSSTPSRYSPFEYPELVDHRGYFYYTTSRPGFPVYFVIGDSTIAENYWGDGFTDYKKTVGAASRGDQPGDIYWSVITGLYTDQVHDEAMYGVYGSGGVALPRGDGFYGDSSPFARPAATINGVNLDIYAGVGPAPGTIYETGAVKGVGSVAIPMVPHDAEIIIEKPDGAAHECRGRADEIGNFICPAGPIIFDLPGVYKVYTDYREGEFRGNCPGSRNGWYRVYAVEKDSPCRVLFDPSVSGAVDFDAPLNIRGRITTALHDARLYYSVVAPGILIDEGDAPLNGEQFEFSIFPREICAQFFNLHDNIIPIGIDPPLIDTRNLWKLPQLLIGGLKEKQLSDTMEIDVFIEGRDENDRLLTAGGKMVLRGNTAIVPVQFMDTGMHHK